MIEYPDPVVRAHQLEKTVGIEDLVWMQIGEFDKVWSIADEDLERSTADKTSAVHFLRFEIDEAIFDDPYAVTRTLSNLIASTPVRAVGAATPRKTLLEQILETELLEKPVWAA